MKNQSNRLILTIYSHFPHYRRPVFDALRDSQKFDFQFAFGPNRIKDGIQRGPTMSDDAVLAASFFGHAIWLHGCLALIYNRRPKVVILLGNPYIISNWAAAALCRVLGIKVLFWTHGWLSAKRDLKSFIRNAYYGMADGLLLYGNRAKQIGIQSGFAEDKMHVIYNSLDYDRQKNVRNTLKNSFSRKSPLFFLVVGRVTPELGLNVAIDALELLRDRYGKSAELWIVGTGPSTAPLRAKAARSGIHLQFIGESYDEELIGRLMQECCAVVSPGKVGLLAMHALAYGTPIITHGDFSTQMPEFEAIEPGDTGDFFARGNADDLARVMSEWIDKPRNEQSRERAIAQIEKYYTPDAQRINIESAIIETLDKK
jgi:glycosyltransferase involved in cell wall biosynthesis